MNVHIPTEMEIFRIAFVTMRGWKLGYNHDEWTKPGVIRELHYHEKESNEFAAKHKQEHRFDGTDHSLEQAFMYEEYNENA